MNIVDGQRANRELNSQEIQRGQTVLASTPSYITIGSHWKCNAGCVFCLGGEYPSFTFERYRQFFEPRLAHLLRSAVHVGFCGFGETLLMPDITDFLAHLDATLPGANKNFTTNGIALSPALSDIFAAGRYSLIVSLHASHAALHRAMTGTSAFESILRNIRYIVQRKKALASPVHINLVFLATTRNIDDLPSFVALAADLGVDRVTCNHVNLFQPEQVRLSCCLIPEKTNEMFALAEATAQRLGVTLVLPPRFGKHPQPPAGTVRCHDPWEFFYVENQGSVNPCCFAGNHIGYLSDKDFNDIWNGDDYVRLRQGHVSGDIHTWCKYCYRYDQNNINDIRSHVTFRPDTQRTMLDYIRRNNDEFGLPKETLEL